MKQLICTKIFIFSDPVESTDTDVQQGRSALDDEAATEETELITAEESRESVTTGTERDDKAEDRIFIDVLSLVKPPPRPPAPPTTHHVARPPRPHNINQPGNIFFFQFHK